MSHSNLFETEAYYIIWSIINWGTRVMMLHFVLISFSLEAENKGKYHPKKQRDTHTVTQTEEAT